MLRSINSTSIVGILKPDDSENFKLQDEHELIYRQYSSKTTNFEGEMAVAICDKTRFNYHPYLSDLNAIIIKEETNDSTPEYAYSYSSEKHKGLLRANTTRKSPILHHFSAKKLFQIVSSNLVVGRRQTGHTSRAFAAFLHSKRCVSAMLPWQTNTH